MMILDTIFENIIVTHTKNLITLKNLFWLKYLVGDMLVLPVHRSPSRETQQSRPGCITEEQDKYQTSLSIITPIGFWTTSYYM